MPPHPPYPRPLGDDTDAWFAPRLPDPLRAKDVPTQEWPQPRRSAADRAALEADRTRLALDGLTAVAEPTVVTPTVPPPLPIRTAPPPAVQPISLARRAAANHPAHGRPPRGVSPQGVGPDVADVRRRLDEAVAAVGEDVGAGLGARIRRVGPGGIFGWKPASGPTLAEVAAARVRIAEEEERRKLRHGRHLDALEITRAYLGVFALILVVVFLAVVAFLATGTLFGWYTWGPHDVMPTPGG